MAEPDDTVRQWILDGFGVTRGEFEELDRRMRGPEIRAYRAAFERFLDDAIEEHGRVLSEYLSRTLGFDVTVGWEPADDDSPL